MAATSSMFMYSLTIQPPSSITQSILGQFAGTKEQQIVTASGSRLTIHRPDPTQAKITTILSQDLFGTIRTLAAFRLAGSNKGKLHSVTFELRIVIRKVLRGSSSHSLENIVARLRFLGRACIEESSLTWAFRPYYNWV